MILEENIDKKKQQVEKQMGCMAGFLQIFDRHQLLAGKRIYTTKRLSSSPVTDSTPSEKSEELSALPSKEDDQDKKVQSSPECVKSLPLQEPATTPKISIDSEIKEGLKATWKFRESPRLSLDSRAIVDGKGSLYPREIRTNAAFLSATRRENDAEEDENDKQRRSPSVVARLMGLEALPESTTRQPLKKPELRRSSSESRSRDLIQSRLIDGNIFKQKQFNVANNAEVYKSEARVLNQTMRKKSDQVLYTSSRWKSQQQQRKNFFDSQDFFPEPKQTGSGSSYKNLEKRLKMRGISEPAEDLETLKQILEALQLKGLLHSRRRVQQINNRNFILEETPIVIMKPSKVLGRTGNQSPTSNVRSKGQIRRNINVSGESLSPVKGRQVRQVNGRSPKREMRFSNPMSPDRNESNVKSPCSPMRRKPLTVETQRKRNDSVEQRRSSPVHSPKINSRKNGSDQFNRSSLKINKTSMAEISYQTDDVSESSFSTTSSQFNTKLKTEDYKEGKNLLARCDKLLNSIAEISTTESQPSPVSVLDSSLYKDELSPLKRRIDFEDQSIELEEDNWSPLFSPVPLQSNDADFIYVSEIVQASTYISDDETDLFDLLEKQCCKNKNKSANVSRLHRQLVFDTVTEILNKKKQLPPWKAGCNICPKTGKPSFRQIWIEFSKIRERSPAENLLQVICGVLKKDLADETNNGWGDYAMETSEMVLDIERLIFKDLVGDTIRDLATFAWKSKGFIPKKLYF